MVYQIKPSRRVIKYLKKLKNRPLKQKFTNVIFDTLAHDPYLGQEKRGDLLNYYTYGFVFEKVSYRIAYTINDDQEIVIVVLAGPHENFYETLKRNIR